jgi:hypothetical protein
MVTGPDLTQMSTDQLQHMYWTLPINTDDEEAAVEAVCVELQRRRVTLAQALGIEELT